MWKKFCEQDTNEENKLRMKYEHRFRHLLRWNITNKEGLFKKELFDKQPLMSLTQLGKYLFGYMCATSNIPYKYMHHLHIHADALILSYIIHQTNLHFASSLIHLS